MIARLIFALVVALSGAGCGRSLAELEAADHASCVKITVDRGDTSSQGYQSCRSNLQQYRTQRAIRSLQQ